MRHFTFILLLHFCLSTAVSAAPKLGEKVTINSTILSEPRSIYISLPDGYETERFFAYPVLYLTDATEQFDHIASTVKYLAGTVSPMIVVGISQQQRFDELMPYNSSKQLNANSDKFKRFIVQEVKPFIERSYQTAEFHILSGHSLGGAFVLNAFAQNPNDFNVYLALSPTLAWGNEQILNTLPTQLKTTNRSQLFTYFEGQSPFPTPKNSHEKLLEFFAGSAKSQFSTTLLNNEDHMSVAHLGSYLALTQLYRGWFLSVPKAIKNGDSFESHYQALSEKLGYAVQPTENEGRMLVQALLSANLTEQAVSITKQISQMYPDSFYSYQLLADTAKHTGNTKMEKQHLITAIELSKNDKKRQAEYRQRLNALR